MENDFDLKVQEQVNYYLDVEHEIRSLKAQRDQLNEEIAVADKLAAELRYGLRDMLQAEGVFKTSTEFHTISIKKGTSALQIEDIDKIPSEFVRVKKEPDKIGLKRALEAGLKIDGVVLTNPNEYSIIINKRK